MDVDKSSVFCKNNDETLAHLFFQCNKKVFFYLYIYFFKHLDRNPYFTPSRLDKTFAQLEETGVLTIGEGALASFSQLQNKFKFHQRHFFF